MVPEHQRQVTLYAVMLTTIGSAMGFLAEEKSAKDNEIE